MDAAGGDPRYALSPVPKRDTNNIQPRVGFNWNPRTSKDGFLGLPDRGRPAGGAGRVRADQRLRVPQHRAEHRELVPLRGRRRPMPPPVSNAFVRLPGTTASGLNPLTLTRTIVAEDFRSPVRRPVQPRDAAADDRQPGHARRLHRHAGHTTSSRPWTATRASPSRPCASTPAAASSACATTPRAPGTTRSRSAPSSGWPRASAPASTTPTASSWTPPRRSSTSRAREVAVAQDSFDIGADKGRSSYDRPHRLTGNFVYELPVLREPAGPAREDLRGLADQLDLHVPERVAVLRPERRRPHGGPGRHRRARGQQHPARTSTPTWTSRA